MRNAIGPVVGWAMVGFGLAPAVALELQGFKIEGDDSLRAQVQLALPPHVGAAVLVRIDGETVLKEVYGSRKLGDPAPVTTDTTFRLAAADGFGAEHRVMDRWRSPTNTAELHVRLAPR